MSMDTITLRPMDSQATEAILTWRYPAPYDFYNFDAAQAKEDMPHFLDPLNQFYAIRDQDEELIGFCSFGADAQVPGGDYTLDALDIGIGLQPDRLSQGLSRKILPAIVGYAIDQLGARRVRVTIAAWNARSMRAHLRQGFREIARFSANGSGQIFVVLMRES